MNGNHHRVFAADSGREGDHLTDGNQTISLSGLKAALLFIDASKSALAVKPRG